MKQPTSVVMKLLRLILFCALLLLITGPILFGQAIEPGGSLTISIQGVSAKEKVRVDGSYPISDKGLIHMWAIGAVKATGLKPEQVARKIEAAYKKAEIYSSPTIQVKSTTVGLRVLNVTVGGQVRKPGPVSFNRGMTLFQAVTAAGGPTEFGAVRRISLYRNNKRYTFDLTKGEHKLLKLKANDTIDVPQTRVFEGR